MKKSREKNKVFYLGRELDAQKYAIKLIIKFETIDRSVVPKLIINQWFRLLKNNY